jgi:hypothetical protein
LSPTLERAAGDEHGRDRAAALVELGLDHRGLGVAVGVGLELEQLGLEVDRLEQLVEIGLLERETSTSCTSPPIFSTMTSCSSRRSRTFCGLASGLSILLIATIIGTPAALV